MEGKIGVIAPGALADLLVVDGNPLEDLGVLGEPESHLRLVMKGGQTYLDRMTGRGSLAKTHDTQPGQDERHGPQAVAADEFRPPGARMFSNYEHQLLLSIAWSSPSGCRRFASIASRMSQT
jgi:hypothetical protein